ncbi:MAG: hypothetical protein JSU86_07485 [Phycisphaerales bacterium]|nr:MAG: hypothetical protein JSU86_07485 [Phycisphaerales bacterium]
MKDVTAAGQRPESMELTLAEVRAAALANNLDLKVELAKPSSRQGRSDRVPKPTDWPS